MAATDGATPPRRFTADTTFPRAKEIRLYDTTLRDGEQTPGVAFTPEQKYELACMLSDAGLHIIETRARSLARFMHAYARLARLPKPTLAPLDVAPWARRVAALETRVPVEVTGGPDVTLSADGDQLEQMLINLLRNAADAALETAGRVWIGWRRVERGLELAVHDEGPGIADTANLFVPFFTTKPEGTGIGLALSRQIAESHGGTLVLENRGAAGGRRPGCTARVFLPLQRV